MRISIKTLRIEESKSLSALISGSNMTYIQGIIEIERPIIANNQMKLMKERRPHVLAMTP
jgi:hypothetical protein